MFGLFSKKKDKVSISWQLIDNMDQLDEFVKLSHEKPVIIFKHSTRCGTSSMALSMLNSDIESPEKYHFFILDLLNYRAISNAIAEKFNSIHKSPQMIVLKNGKVVHDSSHSAIRAANLKQFIE